MKKIPLIGIKSVISLAAPFIEKATVLTSGVPLKILKVKNLQSPAVSEVTSFNSPSVSKGVRAGAKLKLAKKVNSQPNLHILNIKQFEKPFIQRAKLLNKIELKKVELVASNPKILIEQINILNRSRINQVFTLQPKISSIVLNPLIVNLRDRNVLTNFTASSNFSLFLRKSLPQDIFTAKSILNKEVAKNEKSFVKFVSKIEKAKAKPIKLDIAIKTILDIEAQKNLSSQVGIESLKTIHSISKGITNSLSIFDSIQVLKKIGQDLENNIVLSSFALRGVPTRDRVNFASLIRKLQGKRFNSNVTGFSFTSKKPIKIFTSNTQLKSRAFAGPNKISKVQTSSNLFKLVAKPANSNTIFSSNIHKKPTKIVNSNIQVFSKALTGRTELSKFITTTSVHKKAIKGISTDLSFNNILRKDVTKPIKSNIQISSRALTGRTELSKFITTTSVHKKAIKGISTDLSFNNILRKDVTKPIKSNIQISSRALSGRVKFSKLQTSTKVSKLPIKGLSSNLSFNNIVKKKFSTPQFSNFVGFSRVVTEKNMKQSLVRFFSNTVKKPIKAITTNARFSSNLIFKFTQELPPSFFVASSKIRFGRVRTSKVSLSSNIVRKAFKKVSSNIQTVSLVGKFVEKAGFQNNFVASTDRLVAFAELISSKSAIKSKILLKQGKNPTSNIQFESLPELKVDKNLEETKTILKSFIVPSFAVLPKTRINLNSATNVTAIIQTKSNLQPQSLVSKTTKKPVKSIVVFNSKIIPSFTQLPDDLIGLENKITKKPIKAIIDRAGLKSSPAKKVDKNQINTNLQLALDSLAAFFVSSLSEASVNSENTNKPLKSFTDKVSLSTFLIEKLLKRNLPESTVGLANSGLLIRPTYAVNYFIDDYEGETRVLD